MTYSTQTEKICRLHSR